MVFPLSLFPTILLFHSISLSFSISYLSFFFLLSLSLSFHLSLSFSLLYLSFFFLLSLSLSFHLSFSISCLSLFLLSSLFGFSLQSLFLPIACSFHFQLAFSLYKCFALFYHLRKTILYNWTLKGLNNQLWTVLMHTS